LIAIGEVYQFGIGTSFRRQSLEACANPETCVTVPVCCKFWETAGRGRVLSPQFEYNNHLFTRRNFLPSFSVEGIESLFGHEAAENEKPERLRQYYFKGKVYEAITADLPLRILVGHKGTGKSALFAVAQAEDVTQAEFL